MSPPMSLAHTLRGLAAAVLLLPALATARDRGEQVFAKHYFQPLADADVWADRPEILLLAGLPPIGRSAVREFRQDLYKDKEGEKE